jgi:maltose O-acetyltransferase
LSRTLNALQAALPFLSYPLRAAILRRMGVTVGEEVRVDPGVHFSAGLVSIGARTYINVGCFIDGSGGVTIGERCAFGQRVDIITSSHEIGGSEQRAGARILSPVVIEDGCWLGAEATVLPGVTIARGCIIAAGALVTKSTVPDGLYVGAPAARVRDLR